ncbi:MAG: hypothetical protein PUK24_02525 [Elusimicrobia bacterium]|nr:hypothetical protein [Elusimicrobiota bacterium]MDY6039082.1 hypothetical protein [Elusimicrobiaceae bacterium]
MKHFILIILSLLLAGAAAAQNHAEEPEIVIEMRGEQTAPVAAVSIWDKNALQLTRLFRGKDRSHVLYSVENVSTKDDILRSDNAKEYAFVRYGTNDGDYRKFLFKAEDPQTFVACAANLKDVLAVNLKYGVNMGVSLKDFLRVYGGTAQASALEDEPAGKTLSVYKQTYSDVNHKTPAPYYFVFDGDELIQTLAGEKAYADYAKKLTEANEKLRAQNKQAQDKAAQLEKQKRNQAARRKPIKALAYGGTVEDQMYMPRVNNPKFPPPTPSKVPAGTPIPVNPF